MEQWIIEFVLFLKQLSYGGIVLALSFEFVPAEIVLPLAGYWVYQGDFNLILTILAGTVGGTFGPITLYLLGRYGGRPIIEKVGKYFFIKPHHLEKSERFFDKYGSGVAFFGRFVPGIRTVVSIPCGMAKMSLMKFSVYTFLAMLPITTVYVYLGYLFGPKWEEVGAMVKPYALYIGIAMVLLLVLYFLIKRSRRAKAVSTHQD